MDPEVQDRLRFLKIQLDAYVDMTKFAIRSAKIDEKTYQYSYETLTCDTRTFLGYFCSILEVLDVPKDWNGKVPSLISWASILPFLDGFTTWRKNESTCQFEQVNDISKYKLLLRGIRNGFSHSHFKIIFKASSDWIQTLQNYETIDSTFGTFLGATPNIAPNIVLTDENNYAVYLWNTNPQGKVDIVVTHALKEIRYGLFFLINCFFTAISHNLGDDWKIKDVFDVNEHAVTFPLNCFNL